MTRLSTTNGVTPTSTPAPPLTISLVVSTIGRPDCLRRLVDSVTNEVRAGASVELIVVDQSPDGSAKAILEDQPPPFPCTYATSARGVSVGRNTGLALATGDLVMFPDDDAWFPGTTLRTVSRVLRRRPDIDGVCTRLVDAEGQPSMLRWSRHASWVTLTNHHRTSIGSTMIFRRRALEGVAGFNEHVGPGAGGWLGSCEDADFLLRVVETGARLWYTPAATVIHRDMRMDAGADAARKALVYGCGQGWLWRTHRFPVWLVAGLLLRRLLNTCAMVVSGRRDVAQVRRAWVRGALNGLLGRAPADMEGLPADDPAPPQVPPFSGSEFLRSFGFRLGTALMGTAATFALSAIAARELSSRELSVFYALLVALVIGPVVGRLGLSGRAIRDLAVARGRGDDQGSGELALYAVRACLVTTLISAPLVALAVLGSASRQDLLTHCALGAVILFAETTRLTAGDVLMGLGHHGWGAVLAHHTRSVAVLAVVVALQGPLRIDLTINRFLIAVAATTVALSLAGHLRLRTLTRGSPAGRRQRVVLATLARAGLAFMIVDVVAILVARGDVLLAAAAFPSGDAATYSTASVLAMQLGTPVGLANVALAPVVAGLFAQGRRSEIERLVRSFVTVSTALLVPIFAIAVLRGEQILTTVYGTELAGAAPFLNVLLVGNLALAMLGPSAVILLMARRHRLAMWVSVVWLITITPVAVLAAVFGGPMVLAWVSAVATTGLYLLLATACWATTDVRVHPQPRLLLEIMRNHRPQWRRSVRSAQPHRASLAPPSPSGVPWWISPVAPVAAITIPAFLAALAFTDETYRRAWRTPKVLGAPDALLIAVGIGALLLGVYFGGARARPPRDHASWGVVSRSTEGLLAASFPPLVGATLLGYAVWLGNGVLNHGLRFADLVALLTTQDNFGLDVKKKLPTIPGITTLTQLAVVAVVIGVLMDLQKPRARVRAAYRLLILLAVARSFFLAERLAAIELIVPLIVIRATALGVRHPRRRRVLAWAPVIALVTMLGAFTATEYSRSWRYYENVRDSSVTSFAVERLVGYYATAYNNGALLLDEPKPVGTPPYLTVQFLWQDPLAQVWELVPGSIDAAGVAKDAERRIDLALERDANPEFNSPGGVTAPFVDYGTVGGALFLLILGFAIGKLHRSFRDGGLWGLMLYPMAFLSLLELPRYVYWGQGRATPGLAALIALVVACAVRAQRLHDSTEESDLATSHRRLVRAQ